MGLTYRDCQRLGIDYLHPAHRGMSEAEILREKFGIVEEVPQSQVPSDGMNKTERAFAESIELPIASRWQREPIKVRLAGRTWYTPDFGVWLYGEPFTLIEIKGFMRDDAAVKLKVAASRYPEWRWLLVVRDGRHRWEVRQVTQRGIGTHRIQLHWIVGS